MEIDLQQVLSVARRRWWVVLLFMLVAGSLAFVVSSRQDDQFSASAKLLVISGQPETSGDYSTLQTSRGLAETYRQLIETAPVLDRVIEKLDLPYGLTTLDKMVSTSRVMDTQLLQVTVVDNDPGQAATIANTIAAEFRDYITDQVDPRIGAQVEVADPARIPTSRIAPKPELYGLLGAFLGALVGAGLIALLEFLDNTVKPDSRVIETLGTSVLATIAEVPKLAPGGAQVYSMSQPRSSAAESMRLLRANLEFASAAGPIRSLVITSPSPAEGKSTTAANLGVVMAQSGLTVAIIDADLRRPSQHRVFGVDNATGVTTLLTNPDRAWDEIARKVALPGLYLLPSGPLPPNPADLVNSEGFGRLVEQIKGDVDMVIVDSPPVLAASDALVISRVTDTMLLVCHSGKTRIDAARHAIHLISNAGTRLLGVVLNRQKRHQGAAYYGEYYGPPEQGQVTAPTRA